jgi:hypothetical protein
MKVAIVNSKDLGTVCWSARRFCGSCDECDRVYACKLPEAGNGRLALYYKRLEKLQSEADKVREQIKKEEEGK